jgi:hypothetical protein
VIGAETVEHDQFVAPHKAFQAATDLLFFVERQNTG